MIYATIKADGLDDLIEWFRDFEYRVHDVTPLAERCREVMFFANRDARLAGLDKDGYPFAPLADATWDIYESIHGHPRPDGPPLAPFDADSRIVSGFEIDIIPISLGNADVVGSWPSMDDFILYHVTGTRNMPQRNPAGITPSGWAAVADAFDGWLDGLMRGA